VKKKKRKEKKKNRKINRVRKKSIANGKWKMEIEHT